MAQNEIAKITVDPASLQAGAEIFFNGLERTFVFNLSSSPSVAEIVNTIKADAHNYSFVPFTITNQGNDIIITYKTGGEKQEALVVLDVGPTGSPPQKSPRQEVSISLKQPQLSLSLQRKAAQSRASTACWPHTSQTPVMMFSTERMQTLLLGLPSTEYNADANKGEWQYSNDGLSQWTTINAIGAENNALTLLPTDYVRFIPHRTSTEQHQSLPLH